MEIKFKDGIPRMVSLGKRVKPANSTIVECSDGTKLYLIETDYETAIQNLFLNSSTALKNEDAKYFQYAYCEHILDTYDTDMFMLIMDDFHEWHKQLK